MFTPIVTAIFTPIDLNHHVSLSYCNSIVCIQNDFVGPRQLKKTEAKSFVVSSTEIAV